MSAIAVTVISILLTAILALLGYIGKNIINSIKTLHDTLTNIQISVGQGITAHNDLKERVDKLENKIYE